MCKSWEIFGEKLRKKLKSCEEVEKKIEKMEIVSKTSDECNTSVQHSENLAKF